MNIHAGEKVALIGRTGSGKSSVLRVLCRLNTYTGSLLIAGRELRTIPSKVVRKQLTVIPQDPLIFTGTVAFNLDPALQASREDLRNVIEQIGFRSSFAYLSKEVDLFSPDYFLDYSIASCGENLSQGQKQLICLGRAMLRRSKILLIDEATASLDDVIEKNFYDVLEKYFGDATIIMVCHKLDRALLFCDRVIELNCGKVLSDRGRMY